MVSSTTSLVRNSPALASSDSPSIEWEDDSSSGKIVYRGQHHHHGPHSGWDRMSQVADLNLLNPSQFNLHIVSGLKTCIIFLISVGKENGGASCSLLFSPFWWVIWGKSQYKYLISSIISGILSVLTVRACASLCCRKVINRFRKKHLNEGKSLFPLRINCRLKLFLSVWH